jgi:LysM repeat protein
MGNKRLRISLIAIIALLILSTAACTRSASTPPPSSDEGEVPSAQTDTQATMDAIRSAILTQTAQASEGEESPTSTPTVEETEDTAAPEASESPVATTPTATSVPGGQIEYTVKPGDWIWKIARDYNVDPQDIIDLNGLSNPSDISPGMVLKIPVSGTTTEATAAVQTPVAGGVTHIVQPGEWIWQIARTYGVDPQAIINANNLSDPANISPGQELIIP